MPVRELKRRLAHLKIDFRTIREKKPLVDLLVQGAQDVLDSGGAS